MRIEQKLTLRLTSESLTSRHEFLFLQSIDLRVTESKVLHRFHNSGRDYKPGEPFVSGGHNTPWCKLTCGGLDRLLECVHVVVPVVTFFDIGGGELPRLLRRVEALHEAFFLF